MKKYIKSIVTILTVFAIALTAIPAATQTAYAAAETNGTIDLQKKALIIPKGKTTKFKNNTITMPMDCCYQIKAVIDGVTVKSQGSWTSSNPAVAWTTTKGVVYASGSKPGTATIKVTYKGKSKSLKVKMVKKCTHVWKTTKKSTCDDSGEKRCTVCGKNSTTKAECNWETKSYTSTAGYGKPYERYYETCNACKNETKPGKWSDKPGSRGVFETVEDMSQHYCDNILNGDYNHDGCNQWFEKIYLEYHPITITGKYCSMCGGNKDIKESCNICGSLKNHDLSDQAPYWWDNECTALLKLIKANKDPDNIYKWKTTCPPQLKKLMQKNNM